MNVQPLGDRLIVVPIHKDSTTASGIVIPTQAQERPSRASVLAVGDGRWENGVRIPLDVQVGDEIIFSQYSGTEIEVDGDTYLLLREGDVMARCTEV